MYAGRGQGYPVYRCERGNLMMAQARCMSFNGFRTDAAVTREALEAVAPMAIEAALEAERMQLEREAKRRQMIEMDLQQARYEASLASAAMPPATPRIGSLRPSSRRAGKPRSGAWRRARPG